MLDVLSPLLKQGRKIKKGRKATTKPIFVSKKIEIDYTRELLAISQLCQDEASSLVIPEVAKNVGDAWFGEAVKKLKEKVTGIVNGISEKLAQKTVNAQRRESDKQLAQQLEKMTGLDLRNLFRDEDLTQVVEEAIAANVALIESIPSQYADKLQAAILKGLQEGQRASVIAEEIKRIGDVTDSRAKLIATDQLGKINSRITQVRQEKLGITHYTWSTSRDERVRHEHRLRDGKLFAWDKPPKDGHAGQAVRCRCVALPYLEHLIDEDAPKPEQLMKQQELKAIKAIKADISNRQAVIDLLGKDEYELIEKKLMANKIIKTKAKKYGLLPHEVVVLNRYTGNLHSQLNQMLLGKIEPVNQDRKNQLAIVPALKAALAKLPDYQGSVVRRVKFDAETLASHKLGAVVEYKGFSSSTYNAEKDVYAKLPHRLVILSKTGKKIDWLSSKADQKEVLFPPMKFLVKNRRKLENGHIEITLKEAAI